VALRLEEAGYRVAIAGRRLSALEETVAAGNGGMLAVAVDVTDADAVRDMVGKVVAKFGRLDVLFNNAGLNAPFLPLEELPYEKWREVIDTNLTGAFLCTQQAFRLMKDQDPRGGRIINNGSISAHVPRGNSAPYTASKHGMTGLTRSSSLDGRKYDISVGQIDIGNAATELATKLPNPEPMMDVKHVAESVLHMAKLPLNANVQFMTILPPKMPFIGRG
jgi:NAD(P)-dependent dehydrogenase (short-subunit alcohol dehydrogenase family)